MSGLTVTLDLLRVFSFPIPLPIPLGHGSQPGPNVWGCEHGAHSLGGLEGISAAEQFLCGVGLFEPKQRIVDGE